MEFKVLKLKEIGFKKVHKWVQKVSLTMWGTFDTAKPVTI